MRVGLAVCALLLVMPAAAWAREPVISYVDQDGVFRLYDEQVEAEVNPPPAVPADFAGFRYGMSLNGRYIVFNDAGKKIHLLDRATNTQISLPGIDVYANPGSLTVSDTGLLAFDDNGNGPALVYSSTTKQFVDSGLAADNGHRQTRLSGDGRFLGTTCNDDNCVDDLDMGADPYIQDLGAKLDTAFPADDNRDEEHPCLNGDGSVFGIDKDRAAMATLNDVFLFDRSVSPPQVIPDAAGANTELGDEVNCVLDSAGEYLGLFNNTTAVFRAYNIAGGTFLALPADKEFNERSLFSAPYTPPKPPGGGGPNGPAPDTTKPVVRKLGMTHRRFRVRRGATAFRFRLSERSNVKIVIKRRGKRVGTIRRRGLSKGAHRVRFNGRLKGRKLRPGRYLAVLTATDTAGNVSRPRRIRFRVLRPAGDRPR